MEKRNILLTDGSFRGKMYATEVKGLSHNRRSGHPTYYFLFVS